MASTSRNTLPNKGNGNGFTQAVSGTGTQPATDIWRPEGVYDIVTISDLQPGPRKVRFQGRIINTSTCNSTNPGSKKSMLPKGYHFFVIKDDTGLVAIKLLVTGSDHTRLKLGRLVTIWAPSATVYGTSPALQIPRVPLIVTVFPAAASPSAIKFHPLSADATLFRSPAPSNADFLTLKAFLSGSASGARIIVCVDSILPMRRIMSKNPPGLELTYTEVRIFDESETCALKLWSDKADSPQNWVPGQTVLLLSDPRLITNDSRPPELAVKLTTLIEIDPDVYETRWLRDLHTQRQSMCVPFPEDVSVEEMPGEDVAGLCTLAEMGERVRRDVGRFFARVNVLMLGTKLEELKKMGKLCCAEVCRRIYANTPSVICNTCNTTHSLVLNPSAFGHLTDETGCLTASEMVWSDRAYTELLFGTGRHEADNEGKVKDWRTISGMDVSLLKDIDEKFAYSRLTLVVCWEGEGGVGRVCVLGVEW
ncbi:hypothetical protein QBC39DRAFT_314029 [Podospora conica]|nr:hypothetical protein QBC39DRAFT_314029 [Schizothecium conicum]